MIKKLFFCVVVILVVCCFPVRAMRNDSLRFCLLTCSPGTEIYSLFGHTAIRYQNFSRGRDLVFNYGMFNFSTPNFIYRFVKGETDYQLGINTFETFEAEYFFRGSKVYQQVLNLTEEEMYKLEELLFDNYRPENRVYRYNYFYDNCTTRARDMIERCINGRVVYPEVVAEKKSFRSMIHEFTYGFEWEEFGIDLCLGAEADESIDSREQMFSPFRMRSFADKACIKDDNGRVRPLVAEENMVVDAEPCWPESSFPFTPIQCSVAFFLINVVVAYLQVCNKKIYWMYDLILYSLQGLAGCIIAFLFFVSVHPTVGSNWLILLFNPIPLLYLPIMVYNDIRRKKDTYHTVNVWYLTFFTVLFPFIPQEINLSVLPLGASLLANAISHVLVYKK